MRKIYFKTVFKLSFYFYFQGVEYDAECLAELAVYHKRSMKSIEFALKRVSWK